MSSSGGGSKADALSLPTVTTTTSSSSNSTSAGDDDDDGGPLTSRGRLESGPFRRKKKREKGCVLMLNRSRPTLPGKQ